MQINQIVATSACDQPIATPKWLVMFTLYMECEEIQRRFQAQPSCRAEWELLAWSGTTLALLPDTMDEMRWDLSLPLPPAFVPSAEGYLSQPLPAEAAHIPVSDMV